MRKTYIPPGKPTKFLLCPRSLEAAMRARGTSQTALAAAVGASQPAISQILSRPHDPGARLALRIADALEVKLSALLVEVEGEPADMPLSAMIDVAERCQTDPDLIVGRS